MKPQEPWIGKRARIGVVIPSTNIGVESTARAAHEHGYAVVLAEDATTGRSAEMHAFAFQRIFPLLGRVTRTDEIELTQ